MKWGETETCRFVELYREQQCLWKVDNIHYRNKGMRLAAFQHIANEMSIEGLTPTDVKLKIKNLRGTYNQELTKIAKSTLTASSSNEIYIPNVKWFNIMDAFVRQIKEKRTSKDNLAKGNEIAIEDNEPEGIFPDNGSGTQQTAATVPENLSVNPSILKIHQSMQILQKSQIEPISTEVSAIGNHSSRKRRHEVFTSANQDSRQSTVSFNEQEDDEMDVFGKFVALSLKKLSIPSVMSAQSEILSVLTRYRLNDFQSTNSCSTSLSPSDSVAQPTLPCTLKNIVPKIEEMD
ncbi:MADF domain-containing protein [Trichonephila inaurata madagascariensis]|uniref:MADF domain-containing protein n=1 Tax=Trichonephila inaurata madagascariensis TaxID=2747483 RepID=A0A8X6Y366_9ARAC|nr:MADF domain-containing protein [Trichonephila inaurata madagascariensis]